MENSILLNAAEIQSKHSRVKWAEGLILQLPEEHEGRNSWLLNYGTSDFAVKLRAEKCLEFVENTQSCALFKH